MIHLTTDTGRRRTFTGWLRALEWANAYLRERLDAGQHLDLTIEGQTRTGLVVDQDGRPCGPVCRMTETADRESEAAAGPVYVLQGRPCRLGAKTPRQNKWRSYVEAEVVFLDGKRPARETWTMGRFRKAAKRKAK